MSKVSRLALALAVVVLVAGPLLAQEPIKLSGTHYNLNLLGKTTCPGDDLKGTNRHTIMVKLYFSDDDPNNTVGDDPGNIASLDKTNKIFLAQGEFQVLDGNACDGDGAKFQLPANGVESATTYEVFLRELGKPGGSGDLRTCGIDAGLDGIAGTADDEVVCSSENVVLVRNTGRSQWRNVTKELTTMVIQVDIDGDGDLETLRIGIFDPALYEYFWDYDNNGLRLVQLRFYPI
jgi:hypothetical protein